MKKLFVSLVGVFLLSVVVFGCDTDKDIAYFLGDWIESGSGDIHIKGSDDSPYPRYRIPITVVKVHDEKAMVIRDNTEIDAVLNHDKLNFSSSSISIRFQHITADSAKLVGSAMAEDGVVHVNYEIEGIGSTKNDSTVAFLIQMNAVWRRYSDRD